MVTIDCQSYAYLNVWFFWALLIIAKNLLVFTRGETSAARSGRGGSLQSKPKSQMAAQARNKLNIMHSFLYVM